MVFLVKNRCNIALIGAKQCGKEVAVSLLPCCRPRRYPRPQTNEISFFYTKLENTGVSISTIDFSNEQMLQLPFLACSCNWFFLCHQLDDKKSFEALKLHFPRLKIPQNKVILISLKNEIADNKDLVTIQLTKADNWAKNQKTPHFALSTSQNHWYSIKNSKNLMRLKKRTQEKNTVKDFFIHIINHHPWQNTLIT